MAELEFTNLADISLRDGDPDSQAIAKLGSIAGTLPAAGMRRDEYDYYIAGDLMALGRVFTRR